MLREAIYTPNAARRIFACASHSETTPLSNLAHGFLSGIYVPALRLLEAYHNSALAIFTCWRLTSPHQLTHLSILPASTQLSSQSSILTNAAPTPLQLTRLIRELAAVPSPEVETGSRDV